jgi:hypothetical protein
MTLCSKENPKIRSLGRRTRVVGRPMRAARRRTNRVGVGVGPSLARVVVRRAGWIVGLDIVYHEKPAFWTRYIY